MPTSYSIPSLDPGGRLQRMLDALQREGVPGSERAAPTLARLLAGYGGQKKDWTRSTLTADGFPCEFTFGSGTPCVRYALEPAAPSARTRLDACLRLLADSAQPAVPATLLHRIAALQRGGALAYGAWLGVSHDARGDRYKLYAEVPAHGSEPAARSMLCDYLGHSGAQLRYPLRMLGCDVAAGTLEFYFRSPGGLPTDLPLRQAGLAEVLAALARRHVSGFSLALDANSELAAVSRYLFANSALGADPQLRGRVLRHAGRHGRQLPGYAAATASARPAAAGHGLLAWISRFDGQGEFRLGYTPPRLPVRQTTAVPPSQEYCNAY